MALTGQDWVLQLLRITAMGIYAAVGMLVLRRKVGEESKLANQGFAAWWLGLALLGLLSIPQGFGWNIADAGLLLWRIWLYLLIPMIYVALAGLLYYLLFLYTGRHGLYKPIIGFYVIMTGYLVWLIEGFGPFIATDEAGEAMVDFAREAPGWAGPLFSFALVVPIFLAAIGYGALIFRVDNKESKYRIALVSSGIVIWFAFSIFSTIQGIGSQEVEQSFAQQAISQGLGLLAAMLALMAFAPPKPVRQWLDE